MGLLSTLLNITHIFASSNYGDCQTCVNASQSWCVESSKCQWFGCNTSITDILNCPQSPKQGFEYSDEFARTVALPLISAAYTNDPADLNSCIQNHFPLATVFGRVNVDCSAFGPITNCSAIIAVYPVKKFILVSFRGTHGIFQLGEEVASFALPKDSFFDNGRVFDYFFDAVKFLWKGGLQNYTETLKMKYPKYNILVTGHSLGGAEASVFASYIVKIGLFKPEQVRLVTFGQPRTGDRQFADWHDATFPYSYRVVHQKDIVPHVPPNIGGDKLWHHRFEVWYNNNMTLGQPFSVCPEADGSYCSNKNLDLSVDDHLTYFNVQLPHWGQKGCPKE